MKTIIGYDEIRKNAIETRAEMFEKGQFRPGKGIRKKPRKSEKSALLYEKAMQRADRYRPRFDRNGKLILPFFYEPRRG